jgi:hypothetical protein
MAMRWVVAGLVATWLGAPAYAACPDVDAAKATVAAVTLPDCPAGAAGRAVRRARNRVRALLARADARCSHGHDATGLVDKAAGVLDAADTRLEDATLAGKLDADCAASYRAVIDALTTAVGAAAATTTTTTTAATTTTTLVPLSADEKFVRQLFRIELGRDGTSVEWAPFVGELGANTPRDAVATAIQTSAEAFSALVGGFYATYLGRAPNVQETTTFVSALQGSTTDETVLTTILAGAEYFADAPNVPGVGGGAATNATFVQAVFEQLLGRAATPQEAQFYQSMIGQSGRDGVVTAILASAEWRTRVVSGYFTALLGRSGTAGEVSALVSAWSGWRATRLAFEAGAEFYAHAAGLP